MISESTKLKNVIGPLMGLPIQAGVDQLLKCSGLTFLLRGFLRGFSFQEVSKKIARPEKFKPEIVPHTINGDNPGLKRTVSYKRGSPFQHTLESLFFFALKVVSVRNNLLRTTKKPFPLLYAGIMGGLCLTTIRK